MRVTLAERLEMKDMEPEPVRFFNQARLRGLNCSINLDTKSTTHKMPCLQDEVGQWQVKACGSGQEMIDLN